MDGLPRTHQFALIAAEEAMADSKDAPDAIVIGGTTGGIALTEKHLKKGEYLAGFIQVPRNGFCG